MTTKCFGDSTLHSILSFPDKLFGSIDKKSAEYQQKLQNQTIKYLHKLEKQEKRLQRKLAKTDSIAAKDVFGNIDSTYAALEKGMKTPNKTSTLQNIYNGHLDSMQTALKFLDQNKLLGNGIQTPGQLQSAMGSYGELQNKFNGAANVQQYLAQRQQYLTSQLKQYTLDKYLAPFKKEVYYYKAQVEEYTNLFNNADKLEAKLLETVRMLPAYQSFFNKHSELASLFRLPGNDITEQEILGMQTRSSVMQELEQRLGGPGAAQQAVQQGMEQGQGELQSLQNRLNNLTSGSMGNSDASIPNFSPNPQKTKSLVQRIELGANLQSAKPNGFFPITTDIGLSAGYKITSNKVIGIGLSYKIGWGQDIKHINITSQGVGLRSYLDIKLKGSIWISGGFEYNYMQAFKDLQTLHKNVDVWQESALIGLTKKTKIGKTTSNVQLLYDVLWKQQIPNAQPFKFRIGYSLK
ncbi:hypothetical protein [Pinibacter aurantiacus]|uniref:Uncharacterized protein n=1 Tax=Pinibacter aurantiacus TaxID=2851599 RepID=A0A9E2W5W2_9BACT|nr:hypothetical protein [Pinibacter aurantiacus]MBV4359103.1 hypothetical protein [Pinibacter aurantiacus]